MTLNVTSRQGVITALISLQAVIIAIELAFFYTKQNHLSRKKGKLWYRFIYLKESDWPLPTSLVDVRQSLVPLAYTIIGAILIPITFWNANGIHNNEGGECHTNIDADISGVGVRVAIWMQIGTLILISIFGFFHQESTGIKEVGGGLILTHIALAIALAVQIHKGTLTSVDAAIGAAILDAQNLALQIPTTSKETLAARWQVILLVPTQILGLVILPVLVVGLTKGGFASEDCRCLCIFWWSRLSDCAQSFGKELSVFWVYYLLRWIMWAQSCFHSLYNAEWFHESEKSRRDTNSTPGQVPTEEPVRYASIEAEFLYTEYPATISMSYMICALFSLTSMVVAEVSIRDWKLQPSSDVWSVGQIIAIVVAVASFFRAVWSFQGFFNEENEYTSFPDLIFTLLWGGQRDQQRPSRDGDGEQMEGSRKRNRSATQYGTHGVRGSHSTRPAAAHISRLSRSSGRNGHALTEASPLLSAGDAAFTSNVGIESRDVLDRRRSESSVRQQEHDSLQEHSYGPRYRFKYRQPFHLEFLKRIYFPTLTRYLRLRDEGDDAPNSIRSNAMPETGISEVIRSSLVAQDPQDMHPEPVPSNPTLPHAPSLYRSEQQPVLAPTSVDGRILSLPNETIPISHQVHTQLGTEPLSGGDQSTDDAVLEEVLPQPFQDQGSWLYTVDDDRVSSKVVNDPESPVSGSAIGKVTKRLPYISESRAEAQESSPDVGAPSAAPPKIQSVVTARDSSYRHPKRLALLVTTSNTHLRDVDSMAEVLRMHGFYVTECRGEQATRYNIAECLAQLITETAAGDSVVMYYFGRGGIAMPEEDSDERSRIQFFAPIDFGLSTEDDFRGISEPELFNWERKITQKTMNVTIILDCSYDRRLVFDTSENDSANSRSIPIFRARHSVWKRHFDIGIDNTIDTHVVRIVAASSTKTAWEMQDTHRVRESVFINALVRALDLSIHYPCSWNLIMKGVRMSVNGEFPKQYPRLEGPGMRAPFSMEEPKYDATVIQDVTGRSILVGGSICGVLEGNEYDIAPTVSEMADRKAWIAVAKVVSVNAQHAILAAVSGVNSVEGFAFLRKEALSRIYVKHWWRQKLSQDVPDVHQAHIQKTVVKSINASDFLQLENPYELPAQVKLEMRNSSLVMRVSRGPWKAYPFNETTLRTAIDALVSDAEEFARGQHILALGSGEGKENLDHVVNIEFGLLDDDGRTKRLPQDGTAEVPEYSEAYLKLQNGENRAVFVSVLSVSFAGHICPISQSGSPRGLELVPGDSRTLKMEFYHPEKTEGVLLRPKPGLVKETLVVVVSSEEVNLLHLQESWLAPERRSKERLYDLAQDASRLERTTHHILSGKPRDVLADEESRRVPYRFHHLPFMIEYAPRSPKPLFPSEHLSL